MIRPVRPRTYRDDKISRQRLPRMHRIGDPPRPIQPIEKISKTILVAMKDGGNRPMLLSLARVRWLERTMPGEMQ